MSTCISNINIIRPYAKSSLGICVFYQTEQTCLLKHIFTCAEMQANSSASQAEMKGKVHSLKQ